jgi:hypothetical protein
MKKLILILTAVLLAGCQREQVINVPVVTTSGVLVLHEGLFNNPNSYDYSFINLSNDSVYTNVFRNSNNGQTLNAFPDGMQLYLNQTLYVSAQGNFQSQGTIYKINANNNQLQASANFGVNPYSLVIDLTTSKIYVTNLSGSSVTQLDLNLNILIDAIQVGDSPTELISALQRIYVAKASYTSEFSVAILDVYNPTQVSKIFFNAPPISVANNTGGVYVSTYTGKKLYVLDSLIATQVNDSIDLSTFSAFTDEGCGDVLAADSRTMLIVGVDTSAFGYVGKNLYKYDLVTLSLTKIIADPEISDIYALAYEPNDRYIYIGDPNGGLNPAEVRVYNTSGTLVRVYPNTGGYYPARFAFKYEQE